MKMPSLTWLAQSVERGSNKVRIQKRTNKYKTYSNIQSPFKTTAQGHGFDPRIEYLNLNTFGLIAGLEIFFSFGIPIFHFIILPVLHEFEILTIYVCFDVKLVIVMCKVR